MARVSIYVPDELKVRMDEVGDNINWSEVARTAFEKAINSLSVDKGRSDLAIIDYARYPSPTMNAENLFLVLDDKPIMIKDIIKKIAVETRHKMNVNEPSTLTEENVSALLASKDDSQHRQLRVMENGEVVLSDAIGNVDLEGVRCWWETWCEGNGYVGGDASKDKRWVNEVLYDLQHVVPNNLRGFIDG